MEYTKMKRLIICATAAVLALPVAAVSQYPNAPSPTVQHPPRSEGQYNHGEFGVFADYTRLTPTGSRGPTNFFGLGGRIGFNVHPNIALEAEMNYDFEQNYTTINTSSSGGGVTTTTITGKVRPLTGLFGPKFQFGTSGPFRAFVTGKAGFLEVSRTNRGASGSSFANSFDQFGGSGTHFAAYPGGGIETFFGPIGLRVEAGDEIFVNNGATNNLRVTFSPTIRF
jgi:opacity protein-like surface antigen